MTTATAARRPALDHAAAKRLAAEEYRRFTGQLRELAPEDWARPTACPAWDIHAMACHVLGMAEFAASPAEQARQLRAAKRAKGLFLDALTALQVAKHQHRPAEEIIARLAAVTPRAARNRGRTPWLIRQVRMSDQPVDSLGLQTENWTFGYLTDVILTRDTWMHRSDIAAASGRTMVLTVSHDGTLVGDAVAEWAERHGQPCTLTLTGPAGGHWTWGTGGPAHELDAVEFCRIISGRGSGNGLLATRVPF
ncbi:MAG TPA: maleylpyruvate isomerase family mycothiol-dependent enzyme [Streptosporangiaceae bacterium]|nr:maleylpyruvate isomerase family mycothiol-dependent enzyme [Streptosporangiaceae bacterium]